MEVKVTNNFYILQLSLVNYIISNNISIIGMLPFVNIACQILQNAFSIG